MSKKIVKSNGPIVSKSLAAAKRKTRQSTIEVTADGIEIETVPGLYRRPERVWHPDPIVNFGIEQLGIHAMSAAARRFAR